MASQHAVLWRSLFDLILNNDPRCSKKPELVVPQTMRLPYHPDRPRRRPDVLWMDQFDVERMKVAHANFVSDLKALPSSLAHKPGTRGIVVTTAESLFNVLAVSLHMLRKTSSDLPVEIFLTKPTPYTENYCLRVFQPLGARCRYYSDVFDLAGTKIKPNAFQYKVVSILFSSFEQVLFLDPDAWPLADPEALFHSLPFTESGLVFWPDFWYMSESPYFFDVARITAIPDLDERPATETSVMLYDKTKHANSLMLAAYYNYYGPEYYYLLQSQGGEGQGEKETFVWAATALNEPYYFVHQPVRALGHHDSLGEFIGTAMTQADPIIDFFHTTSTAQSGRRRNLNPPSQRILPNKDHSDSPSPLSPTLPEPISHSHQPHSKSSYPRYTSSSSGSSSNIYTSKPLFIHANIPKLDPTTVFDHTAPTHDSNGTHVRCWISEPDALKTFGFDVEKRFWTAMQQVACQDLPALNHNTEHGLLSRLAAKTTGQHRQKQKQDKTALKACDDVKAYTRAVFG